tara:strand:- start:23572 stop:25179 length:1608 start_codon:yes stop_codon:yes gene_type:complete
MKKVFLILLSLFLFISCSKDDPTPEDPIAEDPIEDPAIAEAAKLVAFNEAVSALPNFSAQNDPIISEPVEVTDEPVADVEVGDYLCSTKTYKAAPGFDQMIVLSPLASVIYPGALIKGETISTGTYEPISASRAPVTIFTNFKNIEGSIQRTVEDPSKQSDIEEAIKDILSGDITGATPANMNFSVESVYSEAHLKASIKANYSGPTVDLGGSFSYSSDKIENNIVVKFVQSYYDVIMNTPQKPSDLFLELPDVSSFGSTLPNYVASVNYGRMLLFTATSSYSHTEMQAAFNAAYDSGATNGDVDLAAKYAKIRSSSTIKGFVLGGSGSDAAQTITGMPGVLAFIQNGGNFSKDSPGAALSYTLKNIKDNTISNIVLTTKYNVRQCDKVRNRFKITLVDLDCSRVTNEGSTPEMFGTISLHEANALDDIFPIPCLGVGAYIGGSPFWNVAEDDFQAASNYILPINSSKTFTLNAGADNYVYLTGHVYEEDTGGDDDLGVDCKKLYLSDLLALSTTLYFNGDGDAVTANFTIVPID